MADVLPATVLAPLCGVLADRVERIRLIRLTQAAQSVQAATLATLSFTGLISIETLVVLVLVLGVIQAVAQPARLSLVPSLVRADELSSAVALNSSLFNLARFIGPAIGGFVITVSGVAAAFACAALCFFVFLIIMFRIEPLRNEVAAGQSTSVWSDLREGFSYALTHKGVRAVLILIVWSTVLSRSFYEILPAFADLVFERGAEGLATLVASVGIGAFGSSLWLAGRGHASGLTRIGVLALLVVAIAEAVFASTSTFPLAIGCMVVIGFATVATSISCQTLLQNTIEGRLRGRVMSIYGMLMRAGPAFGALALGALSERFGLQATLLGSAFCCALAWAWAQTQSAGWAQALENNPPARSVD